MYTRNVHEKHTFVKVKAWNILLPHLVSLKSKYRANFNIGSQYRVALSLPALVIVLSSSHTSLRDCILVG